MSVRVGPHLVVALLVAWIAVETTSSSLSAQEPVGIDSQRLPLKPKTLTKPYAKPHSPNFLDIEKTFSVHMPGSYGPPSDTRGQGTTYFVSAAGGGDGTARDKPTTLAALGTGLKPGDTVYLLGGNYEFKNTSVKFRTSGTPDAFITFMAAPGETVIFREAKIRFRPYMALDGVTLEWCGIEFLHHGVVQNCVFKYGPKGVRGGNPRMLGLGYGSSAQSEAKAGNIVRNNAFVDLRYTLQGGGDYRAHALYLIYNTSPKTTPYRNLVEFNYFADFKQFGLDGRRVKGPKQTASAVFWKHGSCGDTVRYNYFRDFEGTAIMHCGASLETNGWGTDHHIHHNVFNNVNTAIRSFLWNGGGWHIHNNTAVDSGRFFSVSHKWCNLPMFSEKTIGWIYSNLVVYSKTPDRGPKTIYLQNRPLMYKHNKTKDWPAEESYVRGAKLFDYNVFDKRDRSLKHFVGVPQDLYGRPYPRQRWNENSRLVDPVSELRGVVTNDFRLRENAGSNKAGLGAAQTGYPVYCGAYDPDLGKRP